MILEELRHISFRALDLLKGAEIRKAYREIKHFDHVDSTSSELKEHREKKLDVLLKHVRATVPYYHNLLGVGAFEDFPVINKNMIQDHREFFISSSYPLESLATTLTSGSTGIPFVCYQNHEKRKRVNAEIIYYSEKAGYRTGYPLVYLRSTKKKEKKSKLQRFKQNQPFVSCNDLSDAGIEKILSEVEKKAKSNYTVLLAYPSTLNELRKYISKYDYSLSADAKLNGVISVAETLYDETREVIEKAFECRCVSRYSNMEQGVIAQDNTENNVFLLNEANYVIEILDMEQDVAVAEGQIGRIVITDLYNFAMPFVRYDTGDIGKIRLCRSNDINKYAICEFVGRRIDSVFDCDGNMISSYPIVSVVEKFLEIRQFQFVQIAAAEYVIKINAVASEQLTQQLSTNLMDLLGNCAKITVEYVEEIPVFASGKRKYIVNEMRDREYKR